MKSLLNLKILFWVGIPLLAPHLILGQEKINIAAGFGYPEEINLGLRYQLKQSQIALYGGFLPGDEDEGFSVGTDYYYHFGKLSSLSIRRSWFVKAGINYISVKEPYNENSSVLFVPRIGRDFNFSRRIGMALEVGLFFRLARSGPEYEPGELLPWARGHHPAVGQSFGVNFFYRL